MRGKSLENIERRERRHCARGGKGEGVIRGLMGGGLNGVWGRLGER